MLVIVWMFIHQNLLIVYDELTITIFAYCLYIRFRQLNDQLNRTKDQRLPVTYWVEMRELYNSLACLTKVLDNHLSWMTLVCFGANLYHICSLLLRIISPDNNIWSNLSMMYSLLFTLTRTFLAALMASSVHEESRRPLAMLYSVPSDAYNGEIYRFQMQATHDEIAITGCNFFSLNRSFMLTVAGTIATYEIVLLQFNSLNENIGPPRNMTNICNRVLRLSGE
ncbi:gustatory receptor for sugar taste 64e-like [Macrosteles quadrilineatus]|uniref:gustatory receptor for sugar taste 64e-like n=1 Tax=Macrosteles quadrilineatus TaxID=74068 RepID=UPI0023E2305B|nr:gustatory receptor for sugar taste 64e-like [Macrosteles quadrilineatus]